MTFGLAEYVSFWFVQRLKGRLSTTPRWKDAKLNSNSVGMRWRMLKLRLAGTGAVLVRPVWQSAAWDTRCG